MAMIDERERFEHAIELFEMPEPALPRLLDRRDRKRRNQRIAAGVVGFAVFVAAVGLMAVGGAFDRTQTPAVPGPTAVTGPSMPPNPTGPAVTSPEDPVGFIGLPPEGARPSTPEVGELVLQANGRCAPGGFCHVWQYADGRLIWIVDGNLPYGANELTTGLLEQRLTPAGVELLVSEFLSTDRCSSPSDSGSIDCFGGPLPGPAPFPAIATPGWTDAGWGLGAEAWEDAEITAFVPSRFGACVLQDNVVTLQSYATWRAIEPSLILDALPPTAADILRGRDVALPRGGLSHLAMTCFLVTTEQARELSVALDVAGSPRDLHQQSYTLGYHLAGPNRLRDAVLWLGPILPHGEWMGESGFG
jgi:hypothetical protein